MTWDEAKPIVEGIEGLLVPGQEEYLFNKVQSLPEWAAVVEIGCYKGRSTMAMALACVGTHKRVYSVDLIPAIARNNLQLHPEARGRVDFTAGYSSQILPMWQANNADMFFVDGSHTMPNVLLDLAEAYRILKPGGWIVVHDYDSQFPDVKNAWDMFRGLFSDQETCHTIRAGRKAYVPHETP